MLSDPTTIRRLYGRRTGHKLRVGQAAMLEADLPALSIAPDADLAALFPGQPLWLEIGFGRGEHMVAQAAAHPDIGIIGAEPFLDGVVGALVNIREAAITNIRLHHGDALDLLDRLPPASLSRAFLLHPDPWPKARHAKRRFVNPGPLALLARALKPGAELRIGTDHPIYCHWTLQQLQNHPDFTWLAETPADWNHRPEDWPPTRYEQKALKEGREVWYFRFQRR